MPLAAADAVEWGSRRIDIAVLGLFLSPAFVGVYYVAQQVASLPAKLKTSFEPVLGPVIARNLAINDLGAVAAQVRQVGFWILAAQAGIALALALPGHAVMALGRQRLHGRYGDSGLPACRRGHRRDRGGKRSGADLRRAAQEYGDQPDHAGAAGRVERGLHHGDADARLARSVAGDRTGGGSVRGAGLRLDRQVAAAGQDHRPQRVGLALGAGGGDRARASRSAFRCACSCRTPRNCCSASR